MGLVPGAGELEFGDRPPPSEATDNNDPSRSLIALYPPLEVAPSVLLASEVFSQADADTMLTIDFVGVLLPPSVSKTPPPPPPPALAPESKFENSL